MSVVLEINKLWQSLGSFWATFEDKGLIEVVWQAYQDILTEKYKEAYQLNLSKSLQYMPEYWIMHHYYYDIIFDYSATSCSGLVNTSIISGLYNYYVEDNIFSFPSGLYNWFYQDSDDERIQEHLVENTDYSIEDFNRIEFKNIPPFSKDENFLNFSHGKLYAPVVYLINPVLFNLFGKLVGIGREYLKDRTYHSFQTTVPAAEQLKLDLLHFKYLIWAISYLKYQPPTINNLKKLYGIAKGVPFAYNSGIVEEISDTTITIDETVHYVPSGLTACVFEGQAIEMFDLLISGIEVYDWVNAPEQISGLAEQSWQMNSILEFLCAPSLDELDHSEAFVSGLMEKVVPKYLTIYYN